jgi:hypothetical protein
MVSDVKKRSEYSAYYINAHALADIYMYTRKPNVL